MFTRRTVLVSVLAASVAGPSAAHHGLMIWDKENVVTLTGTVSEAMDGFPHWEIEVRVDGEDWVIDLGSDFDMGRAGLNPDGSDFNIGASVTVEGYRPKDSDARLVRPRKIILNGKTYEYTTDWD